jgi:hypothetical protein
MVLKNSWAIRNFKFNDSFFFEPDRLSCTVWTFQAVQRSEWPRTFSKGERSGTLGKVHRPERSNASELKVENVHVHGSKTKESLYYLTDLKS